MKALYALFLAGGIALGAIGVAPSAAASEGNYLHQLAPKLAYLSTEQLLAEGYRVCRYISVGRPSADAIPMVVKDLGISVPAALNIVAAAIEELEC
jgi:hypothetical protein